MKMDNYCEFDLQKWRHKLHFDCGIVKIGSTLCFSDQFEKKGSSFLIEPRPPLEYRTVDNKDASLNPYFKMPNQ